MTEQTPEPTELEGQNPDTPEEPDAPFDAPADRSDDDGATGYAVYNRTLGRFVGPVTDKRPSAAVAKRAVPDGHVHAVVRV